MKYSPHVILPVEIYHILLFFHVQFIYFWCGMIDIILTRSGRWLWRSTFTVKQVTLVLWHICQCQVDRLNDVTSFSIVLSGSLWFDASTMVLRTPWNCSYIFVFIVKTGLMNDTSTDQWFSASNFGYVTVDLSKLISVSNDFQKAFFHERGLRLSSGAKFSARVQEFLLIF